MVTASWTGATRKSSRATRSSWRKAGVREKCLHRRTARLACLRLKEFDLPAAASSGIQRDRDRESDPSIGDRRDETVSKTRRDELHESPIVSRIGGKVRNSCNSSLPTQGFETI